VIPRVAGATYTVYVSKQALPGSSDLTFPDGARGYVICDNAGKITITTIGDAQKPVDIFSRRQFMCQVARDGVCTLNDIEYNTVFLPDGVGASYVQDPECFIRIDSDQVFIDFANNGFYCIDYKLLFCVKGVKLNTPIRIKSNVKGVRCFELSATHSKVWHDGRNEYVGDATTTNMLTTDPSSPRTVLIDPDAKVRELFYVEFADGTFSNVELTDFLVPPVVLPVLYTGYYDILQGYRCVPLQPFKTAGKGASWIDTVSLDVTRYNNQTVKLKIQVLWLTALQENVFEVRLEAKHPKQDSIIDFSTESSIKTVAGAAPGTIVFTKWHTKVMCEFDSGESGEIHVYRDVLPYNEVSTAMRRFSLDEAFILQDSCEAYMVDGRVYTGSMKGPNFSTEFDGKGLTFRPRKGVSSYATYDGNGTWTVTPLRAKITFDKDYVYAITTVIAGKIEVPMKSFGDYDAADTFTYTADGSALSKGVFKVKPDPSTAPEATIAVVRFVATDADNNQYPFTVTFVFKDFPRVSFLISDNQDFSSPYFRRTSFTGLGVFNPFWTYGPFIGQPNAPISAFGNQVVNGSLDSNIYPVISFNDCSAGTINKTNGSLEIKAQVLTDDLVIPVGPNDEYVRLNACSSVQYTGSALTVPKNASVSFFRIGPVIYLLRSPLTRAVSFGSMAGIGKTSEAISSANSSPTSGNTFPNPPSVATTSVAASAPAAAGSRPFVAAVADSNSVFPAASTAQLPSNLRKVAPIRQIPQSAAVSPPVRVAAAQPMDTVVGPQVVRSVQAQPVMNPASRVVTSVMPQRMVTRVQPAVPVVSAVPKNVVLRAVRPLRSRNLHA
jgi:hypothetical protein